MGRLLMALSLAWLTGCAHNVPPDSSRLARPSFSLKSAANVVGGVDCGGVSPKRARAPAQRDSQALQGPMGEMSAWEFKRELLGEPGLPESRRWISLDRAWLSAAIGKLNARSEHQILLCVPPGTMLRIDGVISPSSPEQSLVDAIGDIFPSVQVRAFDGGWIIELKQDKK